jgi:ribosome-binding protein aMBF1 (putative translation factor)
MTPEQEFSESLVAHRNHRGWSQKNLGDRLKQAGSSVNTQMVVRIETVIAGSSRLRHVRLNEAFEIAAVFGVTLEQMLNPCVNCFGAPPPRFTCNGCGAEG